MNRDLLLTAMTFLEKDCPEKYLYMVLKPRDVEYEITFAAKPKAGWRINPKTLGMSAAQLLTASQAINKMVQLELDVDGFLTHLLNSIGTQLYLAQVTMESANKKLGQPLVDRLIESNREFTEALVDALTKMLPGEEETKLKSVKGGELSSPKKKGHLKLVE